MGKIKSYTSASGMKTTHYDENGNKIGESWTSASGGRVTHYDADGNKTGVSYKNPSGHMTHYDSDWHKTGHSQVMHSGQVRHYDTQHNRTGESNKNFWGAHVTDESVRNSSHHSTPGTNVGCATMVFLLIAGVFLISLIF